jgi:outer membrane protein assembly factor BamB
MFRQPLGAIVLTLFGCVAGSIIGAETHRTISAEVLGEYGEYGKILRFVIDERTFQINEDTILTWSTPTGERNSLSLPMGDMDYVERAQGLTAGDDLFLVYGIADTDSVSGYAIRADLSTGHIEWATPLVSTNFGAALLDQDRFYVSGSSMLASLNAHDGAVIWSHNGPGWIGERIQAFHAPEEDGDFLIYQENGIYRGAPEKRIRVDKRTGEARALQRP